jgi:hypothetical protein
VNFMGILRNDVLLIAIPAYIFKNRSGWMTHDSLKFAQGVSELVSIVAIACYRENYASRCQNSVDSEYRFLKCYKFSG